MSHVCRDSFTFQIERSNNESSNVKPGLQRADVDIRGFWGVIVLHIQCKITMFYIYECMARCVVADSRQPLFGAVSIELYTANVYYRVVAIPYTVRNLLKYLAIRIPFLISQICTKIRLVGYTATGKGMRNLNDGGNSGTHFHPSAAVYNGKYLWQSFHVKYVWKKRDNFYEIHQQYSSCCVTLEVKIVCKRSLKSTSLRRASLTAIAVPLV